MTVSTSGGCGSPFSSEMPERLRERGWCGWRFGAFLSIYCTLHGDHYCIVSKNINKHMVSCSKATALGRLLTWAHILSTTLFPAYLHSRHIEYMLPLSVQGWQKLFILGRTAQNALLVHRGAWWSVESHGIAQDHFRAGGVSEYN